MVVGREQLPRGAPIGVYLQIYNAQTDQTTLRPAVEVEYVLLKDGKEIETQREDWRNTKMTSERLTLSRLLDSRGLKPGSYTVEVRARDQVSGQALVEKANFNLVP